MEAHVFSARDDISLSPESSLYIRVGVNNNRVT